MRLPILKKNPPLRILLRLWNSQGNIWSALPVFFFNLNSAETNDTIQKIAQEVSPLLSEFNNDITLNEKLFRRVKNVFENKDKYPLTAEQYTLLDKKYKKF